MLLLSTSFAYLFWLANNKNANIIYLSTSFAYSDWRITKKQTSRALLDNPPKAADAAYSVNIASAQAENHEILVFYGCGFL